MKIGSEVFIHGYIDEIRKDTVIIRNEGGYFGTVQEEISVKQEPCDDVISRQSLKSKLKEHHDFFVNAYGGFSNLPQNDKSRVDEITNCIAMVVNEPSVNPQEPTWVTGADGAKIAFWDVPAWKVIKICQILGEPQESEEV